MRFHRIYIAIIFVIVNYTSIFAQKISDSAFNKMSKLELGNYYMKKSHIRKAGGFGLLALGLGGYLSTYYIATLGASLNGGLSNESEKALTVLFIGSTISLVASYPVLCAGAKFKGKAESFLRTPGLNESPSDIQALVATIKNKQKINSVIAWTMLLGGFAGYFISATTETKGLFLISTLSIFGSLPAWMGAARNKGSISVLMGQQSVPVGYLLPEINLTSIGLSIPISASKSANFHRP